MQKLIWPHCVRLPIWNGRIYYDYWGSYEKLYFIQALSRRKVLKWLTLCYYTENKEEVYATPYLSVRLNKEQDIDLLTSYAEKYALKIIKQDSFLPLWYVLSITQNSEKSTLECANEIFESGCFASSVLNLAAASSEIAAIRFVTPTTKKDTSKIYDITGRRLSARPTKGLYIEDGKVKVGVKDEE
ncbi:MAG: hypothetical protein J6W75_04295 [Bacteroidaceae bacterium]|nr:hypothetical protein [Bacteroidaceae bacterium]